MGTTNTMQLDPLSATEGERVELWRYEQLERAGYTSSAARRLASCADVDLHLAVELVRIGCPPDLALRILI